MPRHPIYALWCHPRSMSTATERLMRERGDLTVLHEPFMYDYYVHRGVRHFPHFEPDPDRPLSYDDTRAWVLAEAEKAPVFFKDMAFYVTDRLPRDPDFARAMTHAFLIRHPARSIPSYWKKDPDVTEEEVGHRAQARLREALTAMLGHAPPVVRAEDIQRDPEGTVGRLWQRLGLPPAPHAFTWDEGQEDDWEQVAGWHDRVSATDGIQPPRNRDGVWDEAVAAEPRLADLRRAHQPAYDRLAVDALGPREDA